MFRCVLGNLALSTKENNLLATYWISNVRMYFLFYLGNTLLGETKVSISQDSQVKARSKQVRQFKIFRRWLTLMCVIATVKCEPQFDPDSELCLLFQN